MYVCTCVCTLFTHLLYASQCVWRLSPCPCPFQHLCQSQSCDIPWRLMHPHSFACWCFHAHTHTHTVSVAPTHTHTQTPALAVLFSTDLSFYFFLMRLWRALNLMLVLDWLAGGVVTFHFLSSASSSPPLRYTVAISVNCNCWRWQIASSWPLIGIVNARVFHNHSNKKNMEIHRALCRIKMCMCKIKNNNNNNTAL